MNSIDHLTRNTTIGEIVAKDFRTAEVFREAGIDFCCGGNKSIEDACTEKSVNPDQIMERISALKEKPVNQALNFNEWDLVFLCDYIVNTHHKFVLKSLPDLLFYTGKIADVHGEHHPELVKVAELTRQVNDELLQHLKQEEEVLFPAIKKALKDPSPEVQDVIHREIERMTGEHDFAGSAMATINELTSGYQVPGDGCNTYQVALNMLKQFEDDLHVHVHLENNILYPKALKL